MIYHMVCSNILYIINTVRVCTKRCANYLHRATFAKKNPCEQQSTKKERTLPSREVTTTAHAPQAPANVMLVAALYGSSSIGDVTAGSSCARAGWHQSPSRHHIFLSNPSVLSMASGAWERWKSTRPWCQQGRASVLCH